MGSGPAHPTASHPAWQGRLSPVSGEIPGEVLKTGLQQEFQVARSPSSMPYSCCYLGSKLCSPKVTDQLVHDNGL